MPDMNLQKYLLPGLLVIALLWLGLLAGVSFLATPVKFLAPSLSLPVALDVGRQTFAAFNKLEVLLTVLLALLAWFASRVQQGRLLLLVLALLLTALVLLQTAWLLPVLDARVEVILQGGMPPASNLHNLYIILDLAKLVLLAVVVTLLMRRCTFD